MNPVPIKFAGLAIWRILRNWYNDGLRTYRDWDAREDEQVQMALQRGSSSGGDGDRSIGSYETTKEEWGWEV